MKEGHPASRQQPISQPTSQLNSQAASSQQASKQLASRLAARQSASRLSATQASIQQASRGPAAGAQVEDKQNAGNVDNMSEFVRTCMTVSLNVDKYEKKWKRNAKETVDMEKKRW